MKDLSDKDRPPRSAITELKRTQWKKVLANEILRESALLREAKEALEIAEAMIHDEYDGTGELLKEQLDRLEPLHRAIAKIEQKDSPNE